MASSRPWAPEPSSVISAEASACLLSVDDNAAKVRQGEFNRELSRHPTVPGLPGAGKDPVAASRHSLSSPFFNMTEFA
jgi:hypothetical protein